MKAKNLSSAPNKTEFVIKTNVTLDPMILFAIKRGMKSKGQFVVWNLWHSWTQHTEKLDPDFSLRHSLTVGFRYISSEPAIASVSHSYAPSSAQREVTQHLGYSNSNRRCSVQDLGDTATFIA